MSCTHDEEMLRSAQLHDDEIAVHLSMSSDGMCPTCNMDFHNYYVKRLEDVRAGTHLPNGVPIVTEAMRYDRLQSSEALRDLISTLWLYIGRHEETQLTTEQKELLADVVETDPDKTGGFTYDRWWRT